MRRAVFAAVLLTVSLVPAAGAQAHLVDVPIQRGANWILLEFTSDQTKNSIIEVSVQIDGHRTRGPLVAGHGLAVTGDGGIAFASVASRGEDGIDVATSGSLGRTRTTFVEARRGRFSEDLLLLAPTPYEGHDTALLFFLAGAAFDRVTMSSDADAGSVHTSVRTGGGARAKAMSGDGTTLVAGPVGAGAVSWSGVAKSGLVGAFERQCACAGTWTDPTGLERMWMAEGLVRSETFAGPPGRWSWSWTGASVLGALGIAAAGSPDSASAPVAAAWAPIGDAWRLFAAARR